MHTSVIFSDMQEKTRFWREDNDCTVKAIAIALDICYAEAWYACRRVGRKYRQGMDLDQIITAVKSKNKDMVPLDFQGDVIRFMQWYPRGSYIIRIPQHIMSLKDGVVHDCSENWHGIILNVWHILDPMDLEETEAVWLNEFK